MKGMSGHHTPPSTSLFENHHHVLGKTLWDGGGEGRAGLAPGRCFGGWAMEWGTQHAFCRREGLPPAPHGRQTVGRREAALGGCPPFPAQGPLTATARPGPAPEHLALLSGCFPAPSDSPTRV